MKIKTRIIRLPTCGTLVDKANYINDHLNDLEDYQIKHVVVDQDDYTVFFSADEPKDSLIKKEYTQTADRVVISLDGNKLWDSEGASKKAKQDLLNLQCSPVIDRDDIMGMMDSDD